MPTFGSSCKDRLDHDFEVLSNIIRTSWPMFPNPVDTDKCQAWIETLCGNTNEFAMYKDRMKKCWNVYLCKLISCIKNQLLIPPFDKYPKSTVDLFQNEMTCKENEKTSNNFISEGCELHHLTEDGTTFLSTKALPDGLGAMGYLAVSIDNEPPLWFKSGESNEAKPIQEIINSSNLKEIHTSSTSQLIDQEDQLINLYTKFIAHIQLELDGKINAADNRVINDLIDKMKTQLKIENELQSDLWELFELDRCRLLHFFKNKFVQRLQQIKPEAYEQGDYKSCSEETLSISRNSHRDEVEPEVYTVPTKLKLKELWVKKNENVWNDLIFQQPSSNHLRMMNSKYPPELIEMFLHLLVEEKKKTVKAVIKILANHIEKMQDDVNTYVQGYKDKYEKINEITNKYEGLINLLNILKTRNYDDTTINFKQKNEKLVESYETIMHKKQTMQKQMKYLSKEVSNLQQCLKIVKNNKKNLKSNVLSSLIKDVQRLKYKVQKKENFRFAEASSMSLQL